MKQVLTNLIPAKVSDNFSFHLYTVECANTKTGEQIESRATRAQLFHAGIDKLLDSHMTEKERQDFKRTIFFIGSGFYSARPIKGIDTDKPMMLYTSPEDNFIRIVQVYHYGPPNELGLKPPKPAAKPAGGDTVAVDSFRCGGCTAVFQTSTSLLQHCTDSGHQPVYELEHGVPAPWEVFIAYANLALGKALDERLARWGREHVDPSSEKVATDRNGYDLGVNVFKAYSCNFGLTKRTSDKKVQLTLTCDLRAKIIRTKSVLDNIYGDDKNRTLSDRDKKAVEREWVGEVIIYKNEKKCTYLLVDFIPY